MLAYLRTINNGQDDVSVKRIINVPKRGIGLTTIDRLMDYSISNDVSFYNACVHAEQIPGIGRGASKVSPFVSLIEILKSKVKQPNYSIADLFDELVEATGYVADLEAEDTVEARARIENIDELRNKIVAFQENAENEPTLNDFLEEVALVADIDRLDENVNVVTLMTLHSAKGLEFPNVFLCGMEDGVFPSYMSIMSDDPMDIEEERRLCYVGITRAMKRLSITAARQRMQNGEMRFNKPSRFVHEIPRYLMTQVASPSIYERGSSLVNTTATRDTGEKPFRFTSSASSSGNSSMTTGFASRSSTNPFADNPMIQKGFRFEKPYQAKKPEKTSSMLDNPPAYGPGDQVSHVKFGTGTVVELKKGTKDYEVTVAFDKAGQKKLLAGFAKLEKI